MFDRDRAAWEQTEFPVQGPVFRAHTVDKIVVHYTAAKTIPSDVAGYLAAIQKSYTQNRGYSIGYNAAIDQTGVCWELRGFDFRCASNKPFNESTFAVLMLVDGADPANDKMVVRARQLVADVRRVCPNARIVGHRDVNATACPGAGLYSQVVGGVFEPKGSTDMIVLDYLPGTANWVATVYTGTHLAWVRNGHADQVLARTGVVRQTVNRAEFQGIIQSAKTTTPAPPMDSELVKLWKRSA